MLALPAEAGGLGERLLHQRRRIDEDLDLALRSRAQAMRQMLELALDHIVIVAPQRIDRDDAGIASSPAAAIGSISGA